MQSLEKSRLQEERQRTLDEIGRLRSYMEIGVEERIVDAGEDSVDAAADVYEREKTLAIIQTLENKLAGIDRALKAADQGSYGICEICGQPIDPDRLEFMPQTTTCVNCQRKLERQPKRRLVTVLPRDEE